MIKFLCFFIGSFLVLIALPFLVLGFIVSMVRGSIWAGWEGFEYFSGWLCSGINR